MKQYAGSRKVVIIQNPGKGNIEQAIFIIKREVKNCDEDYIIDEAKKIIESAGFTPKISVSGDENSLLG